MHAALGSMQTAKDQISDRCPPEDTSLAHEDQSQVPADMRSPEGEKACLCPKSLAHVGCAGQLVEVDARLLTVSNTIL